MDSNLGKSLKYLLEFEEGSIQDSLGVSFTASVNPLIDDMSENSSQSSSPEYVNLKPSGDSIYVDRGNRCEFVKLFTRHALYGSCKSMVDAYLLGIRNVFGFGIYSDKLIALCTHEEVIIQPS